MWTVTLHAPTVSFDGGYVFGNNRGMRERHHQPQTNGDYAMVITTISYMVAPGKNAEAIEFFQKLKKAAKKVNGTDLRIAMHLAGPAGHFILSAEYESVKKWDEGRTKVQNDASIQKLIVEGAKGGLFLPGTTTMALWQEI
jgi:hypothetical protein